MSVFLITIILGIRYSIGEFVLGHWLSIEKRQLRRYFSSIAMIVCFEIGALMMDIEMGVTMYTLCLIAYSFLSYDTLKVAWGNVKLIITE